MTIEKEIKRNLLAVKSRLSSLPQWPSKEEVRKAVFEVIDELYPKQ